jgi:hypothetical protein
MWTSIISMGAAALGAFGKLFSWMSGNSAKRAAKAEGQAEFMRETIEDIDDVNKARHRLRNPSHLERVRRTFQRSDK